MTKFLIQGLIILPFFFLTRPLFINLNNWLEIAIQFVGIFAIVSITDVLIDKYRKKQME